MRNQRTSLAVFAFLMAAGSWSGTIKRAQHPALSPDGSTLAFSWQGDIWSVASSGGAAKRLTVHSAMDQMPKWTPDGSRIVFSSNRYGSFDLFSMKPDGTDLKRITFESATEYANSFSPDGTMIYGYTNAWGRMDLFRVPIGGGDVVRITPHPLEQEYLCSVAPDGKTLAFTMGGGAGGWRNPKAHGSATGDIWLADIGAPLKNYRNITKNEFSDMYPLIAKDGKIYFVSNRSGWPNLWVMNGDGSSPKQLTKHSDGTVRMPNLSREGGKIAYEFESGLWLYDIKTGDDKELSIDVSEDQRTNPVVDLAVSTAPSDYSVSPDGKRIALVVRGDIFMIPERGGTTRRMTTSAGLDYSPQWLDAKTILFVTGRNITRELMTVGVDGTEKTWKKDLLDLTAPAVSPDGKLVAYHRGGSEIVVAGIDGTEKRTFKGNFGDGLRGSPAFSWSPDSKWIVAEDVTGRGTNIVIHNVEEGKSVTVARTARGIDGVARFLPNGRGVYFTTAEFSDESDLFVVDLVPSDLTFSEDDLDGIDQPKKDNAGENKVTVYEPGIFDRMRRLTASGASGAMASPDSKTIWTNVGGQISAVSVSGGAAAPVAGVTGPVFGMEVGKNQKLYFIGSGKLFSFMPATGQAAPINFSANLTVNLRDEEMALFKEIWWAMDRFYYAPNINNSNWPGIRAKFEKLVPHAYDRADFYAMMGEMMEEIDSSHLGSTPPTADIPGAGADSTAFLGVEWDWSALDARGEYIVAEVMSGTPAAHPQSLLMKGDKILSVDGVKPGSANPMASLLNRKSGKKVALKIERGGKPVDLLIKPTSSLARTGVNYENWVAWEREQVEKLSNGKLTYLHIEGMDEPSWLRFLREIRTLTPGKKGVVIDVRFNGGGSTAQKILGVLIKSPWLIRTSRYLPGMKMSENIYRGDSLELPSALLINQHSFSNAEIFAEGFRRLKIGPIIGVPTGGGVIGTSSYSLWDGGQIRMPAYGAYAIDGENLEGNGRKPDFPVAFDPGAYQNGRDMQLEKAVEELLKRVK